MSSPKISQEKFHKILIYLLIDIHTIFPSSSKVFNLYRRNMVIKYQTLKLKGLFNTSYLGGNNFKPRFQTGLLWLKYFVDFSNPSKNVGIMTIKP